jgi:hypothetical protein
MLAIVAIWPIQAQDSPVISHACVATVDDGCIQASIADEVGAPLKGIEVDIFPADKVGDERWDQKKSASTDSQGIYAVGRFIPGEYLIAVHYYTAPDPRRPFPTTFYLDVEVEGSAERVSVRQSSPVLLRQLKLRRLQLQKIKVDVLFAWQRPGIQQSSAAQSEVPGPSGDRR